jgi:UDP-N-acetylglucosamine 1-carboxyvinyltransferase
MQKLIVHGGTKLRGEIELQGSKNSALPILAAAYLCSGKCVLHNCPKLTDIYAASRILNSLGCKCTFSGNTAEIIPSESDYAFISDELMREMRSSIIFLGALLGRHKKCTVSYPGGCELGPRPIDMHLAAFRKMGVEISENFGKVVCNVRKKVHGTKISLAFPSVGATENIMLCAVLAEGETIINNAAREPEIQDLAEFLRRCGAKIKGDGESRIVIEGVEKLGGCEYSVMSDRIACATYLSAVAGAGGEAIIHKACLNCIEPFISFLDQTGCSIYTLDEGIYVRSGLRLKAIESCIRTMPHPGFPTDAQAVFMAALLKSDGTSVFEENIFDCRYRHTDAMKKMGADIKVIGKTAVVQGVDRLYGANVEATDLRGGAAMVIAGLMAEGTTEVSKICYIDRGYEEIEVYLRKLGADIRRE